MKNPIRPSTRGQLAENLKNGIACEVAEHVSEMTEIMLRGWLEVEDFKVVPSENEGWAIFEPTK